MQRQICNLLLPPLPYPLPSFSPSLINLIFLWTLSAMLSYLLTVLKEKTLRNSLEKVVADPVKAGCEWSGGVGRGRGGGGGGG